MNFGGTAHIGQAYTEVGGWTQDGCRFSETSALRSGLGFCFHGVLTSYGASLSDHSNAAGADLGPISKLLLPPRNPHFGAPNIIAR